MGVDSSRWADARARGSGSRDARARARAFVVALALIVVFALGRRSGERDARVGGVEVDGARAAEAEAEDARADAGRRMEAMPRSVGEDARARDARVVVDAPAVVRDVPAGLKPLEVELEAARGAARRAERAPTSSRAMLDPRKIRTISFNAPRAFLYEGFLTEDEAAHVLELSEGRLHKSGVVDAKTGGATMSDVRTSTGTFISRNHDAVVSAIEARIELWAQIPQSHHEAFQVLRYEPGQEYKAHFDYFFHKGGMRNNRIATVLLYLTDVEEGGETTFPNTDVPTSRNTSAYSTCGNGGRGVKARRGDALLFWSMKPGGELDSGSSHAGCPVIKGEKWTATKWMHVNPIGAPSEETHKVFYDGGPRPTLDCNDAQDECRSWAEGGECDKNPGFMHVSCKMSCRLCVGDWRDGGYDKPPKKGKTSAPQ